MTTIVKIGYHSYAFQKESDAAQVIRAMAGAVQLDSDYTTKGEVFYPSESPREISMIRARDNQFRDSKPRSRASDIEVDASPLAVSRRRAA